MKKYNHSISFSSKQYCKYRLLLKSNSKKINKYYFHEFSNSSQKIIFQHFLIVVLLTILLLLLDNNFFQKFIFKNDINKYFIPNTYRIAFVFGTRPEALKLFPLIKELKQNKKFVCIIINTGQHKEMLKQILDSLNFYSSIDFNLNIMRNNQSLSQLTSRTISEIEKIYNLIKPNAVIVQGDTTTGFSAAVSAYYQKIPIFHVEAGLRTHNLKYPFPEEFNRLTIDDITNLYFCPTDWAASNLLKENKESNNIYVTGNTIVDTLYLTLNNTSPSKNIKTLIKKSKSLCSSKDECKIILLTCHRRENYFEPINNILNAVQQLLKTYNNIVIIFPFHLNPNVKQSIQKSFPENIYDNIIEGKKIKNKDYLHLNRMLLIPPLNYFDLIHLESFSYFIMSDSGGIQEEAVSLGKPILILRENTERPEAVKSGYAILTGLSYDNIYNYASSLITNITLYQNVSKPQKIYGNGNSSIIISDIIQNYFLDNKKNSISFNNKNFLDILSQYDNYIFKSKNQNFKFHENIQYDIVIVLTVWRRNNLEKQLNLVKTQTFLKNKKTNIIIFQNNDHVNVDDIVNKWKQPNSFSEQVVINFIHSPIETGYFGRFLAPLTSSVNDNSYFFICDDDIVWGRRYFENMARVINEGSLATRNGRIITENYQTYSIFKFNQGEKEQVCFNEDIEHDFGGHIWAGRISWLRKAWNHIPYSFENCEDFWISAVLKSFYNITTKMTRCPCPDKDPSNSNLELCSNLEKIGINHENALVGKTEILHSIRAKIIEQIIKGFNFQRLIYTKPYFVKLMDSILKYGRNIFNNINEGIWKDSIFSY